MGYMDSWRPCTDLLCVSDISVKPCTMASPLPLSSGLGAMQFCGMMDPEPVSLLVLVVVMRLWKVLNSGKSIKVSNKGKRA